MINVFVIGSIAPPLGGVSTHVERVAQHAATDGLAVRIYDIYSLGEVKRVNGCFYIGSPFRSKFASVLWLSARLSFDSCDVAHFHFSNPIGWMLVVAFLGRKGGGRSIITLHDGDLNSQILAKNPILRAIVSLALTQFDFVVALSSKHVEAYQQLGLNSRNIIRQHGIPKAILHLNPALLPNDVRRLRSVEDGGSCSIIIASGYAQVIYGFEHCFTLLEQALKEFDCKLILSIYGAREGEYYAWLSERITSNTNIIEVGPVDQPAFLALLKLGSLYVRPSSVDSFGVAIVEALDVGTPCLASNVCERDERCATYSSQSVAEFIRLGLEMLRAGRNFRRRVISTSVSIPVGGPQSLIKLRDICGYNITV